MRKHLTALALAILTLGALAVPAQAAGDDDFSSSLTTGLYGDFEVTVSNAAASKEPGEPDHAGNAGGHSLWWTWQPAADGPITIDTCDSDFDTLLAVYTGDGVGALTETASSDDDPDCFPGSKVTFVATAGTTYRIVVDGYDGLTGHIGLRIATQPPPSPLYLALGDSVSSGYGVPAGRGFVDLYFDYLRDPGHAGVGELANLAVPGETSGSMLATGGQMDRAIGRIGESSDTRVVTLSIGGNDGRFGQCPIGFADPPCPFKDNYTVILARLRDALAGDPGSETVQAMEYYNPATGTGTTVEGIYEYVLLGEDGRVDCSGSGRAIGLNDQVRCIARDHAATSVDPHPTFKMGGQSLIADGVHPNEAGHGAIACLFERPERAGSARPCEALQPPTTDPDTRAPKFSLSGARAQRIIRKRGVVLLVETDEAASVTVSGTVGVPRQAAVARFRPITRSVSAHSPTKFSLRLTKKSLALVRRGLRVRRALTARIRVRARDAAGNSSVAARTVRVTR